MTDWCPEGDQLFEVARKPGDPNDPNWHPEEYMLKRESSSRMPKNFLSGGIVTRTEFMQVIAQPGETILTRAHSSLLSI